MKVTSYSTARYSTWHYLPELDTLIDCGDGVCMKLGSKISGLRHIFITHSDRDHISSLMRVVELIPSSTPPKIYYPKDCMHMKKLIPFIQSFDGKFSDEHWVGISNGDVISIRKDIEVVCHTNNHIKTNTNLNLSFGFKFYQVSNKLKSEYIGLPGNELGRLRKSGVEITRKATKGLFGFSGDCMLNENDWLDIPTLIHECTFINRDVDNIKHRHTYQSDLVRLKKTSIKNLVLTHISTRYSNIQFKTELDKLNLPYNIQVVYPNKIKTYEI